MVTIFSLNGTTNSESEGAPFIYQYGTTIWESQRSSFDSTRYDDLGAPVREKARGIITITW